MPACAVMSVNVIGPEGRGGAELYAVVDAGRDGVEDGLDGGWGGGGGLDLQPAIAMTVSTRHCARNRRD